jgi:hypothetical protein
VAVFDAFDDLKVDPNGGDTKPDGASDDAPYSWEDPRGAGGLEDGAWQLLERLHPEVAAEIRAEADAAWAATIEPHVRDRIDDYVDRYRAGEDLDAPDGRSSLDGEEMAILERLYPDIAAQREAAAEAAWAATIEPNVRDRIDDYVARFQAGKDLDAPEGRNLLDGEEMAILERLHPDIAAQREANAAEAELANVDPKVRADVDRILAEHAARAAGRDADADPHAAEVPVADPPDLDVPAPAPVAVPPADDDVLGLGPNDDAGADDGGQPDGLPPLVAVQSEDGVIELEQIEMATADPVSPEDLALATAVVSYEPPPESASESMFDDDEMPIDYGGSIADDPDDYQPN